MKFRILYQAISFEFVDEKFIMKSGESVESRFGRGAIESSCRTLSGLELEIGAWSFWRTEERRQVRRGWPPEYSGWTFQVGGAAGRLCARGFGVFSERARAGWGRGVASTRMAAGWELELTQSRGGRGPLAAVM